MSSTSPNTECLVMYRFKGGEQKVYEKEKDLAGKVKQGASKAGETAEHDYDR